MYAVLNPWGVHTPLRSGEARDDEQADRHHLHRLLGVRVGVRVGHAAGRLRGGGRRPALNLAEELLRKENSREQAGPAETFRSPAPKKAHSEASAFHAELWPCHKKRQEVSCTFALTPPDKDHI